MFAPTVRSTFYRAVDPAFADRALNGSRSAGRYSRADQPTLYLSSSPAGVQAAMVAHTNASSPQREILAFDVVADRIVDLRDAAALAELDVDLADATADWQGVLADGGTPSSWSVRDRLEAAGANGLIDPSRKQPGLWHLALFRWNEACAPTVSTVQRP